jgi:hypothetical protein
MRFQFQIIRSADWRRTTVSSYTDFNVLIVTVDILLGVLCRPYLSLV